MHITKTTTIKEVCQSLSNGTPEEAAAILKAQYPFSPKTMISRRYGPAEATGIFIRDGFIDRYSGDPLIYPPVLRILSIRLPAAFPYHPNWKTDVTHAAYWELTATVDHLIPISLGGADDESNWITTSMAHNSAKLNWTLKELGWRLHPSGDMKEWDGLFNWFLDYTAASKDLLNVRYVHHWYRAAKQFT